MTFYLGVDGGGTKTELVCIDAGGTVRAATVTGTTYHPEIGLAEVERRLEDAVAVVCRTLAIAPADLGFVFFGLPGFGEDSVADPKLERACGRVLGHDRYLCANDMVCGWAGALGGADGVNIVAGTGSIGYGEYRGRSARVGGWGDVFGDEGSACWIALQGLALFSRMSDGRASVGPLHGLLRERLALADDLQLCQRVIGPAAMGRSEIAALATVVSQAAEAGDAGARAILMAAADELVALATALRRTLDVEPDERIALSWSGGVLAGGSIVRDAFTAGIANARHFDLVEPKFPPGLGAALYARAKSSAE